jgi:Cof subfamily protein (haloacid dehalogenase superfamily)
MNIKLLAIALDGTLLRSDKTVSEYTLSVLRECRKRGIKIIFATVRGATTLFFDDTELFDGCVKNGGATAFVGDKMVFKHDIPITEIRPLLHACIENNICAAAQVIGEQMHYSNFNVSEKWSYIDYFKIVDFSDFNLDVVKFYALADTAEQKKIISRHLPDYARSYVCRDNITFVFHQKALKSIATMGLADYWGIKREEIAAFGDDIMDVEFLEWAGIGVAMSNALDEVKAVADHICETNDNDGVAKWLEENVL